MSNPTPRRSRAKGAAEPRSKTLSKPEAPSDAYQAFLASKVRSAQSVGFDSTALPDTLFPYQRDLVTWACRRGRAALFADTGTGKTAMQLAWASEVQRHTGGRVLVLAPLAVAAQTVNEGRRFGIPVAHVSDQDDVGDAGIVVTNYDKIHRFDASAFSGVVLDESSILKHHDAKTRTLLIEAFRATPYRLACTATPAPNDLEELGNHAEFLGLCSRVEMLSEYFCHDGGETQTWRLKGHARDAFWRWLCSWAAVLRSPEDLGYDGASHKLPELHLHQHAVTDESGFAKERGLLFATDALSLDEQRKARRATLDARVATAAALVASEPDEPWLLWCDLNDESDALARAIPGAVEIRGSDSAEAKEDRLLGFAEGRYRVVVTKASIAGWGLNWQHCARVIFVGVSHSFEAYYQAIRRCWRFGQKRPVECHLVTSDIEGAVLASLQRKQVDAIELASQMSAHTRQYVQAAVRGLARETNPYDPRLTMRLPSWLTSEVA